MAYERCPACGTKVKSENLSRHMKKVHPDEEVGEEAKRPTRALPKKGILAALVLVVVVVAIVSAATLWPTPNIKVSPSVHDFGVIPQQTRTVTIEISNEGNSDLHIKELSTSCVCTSVVLRIGERSSPEFRGQNPQVTWFGETLSPGQHGYLEIEYDPTMFSDHGPIKRFVYVNTNDPDRPEYEIELRAYVE